MARRLAGIALALLMAAGPSAAAADVFVAIAAPLSGHHRATGEAVRGAAESVVRALNDAGGLLGQRVSLMVEDDGCDSTKAAAIAKAFAEKQPALVVGHPCSGAAIVAAPYYAAGDVVFIAPGVRHPALTEKRAGPSIFRIAGRDDRQGEAAAQWLERMSLSNRIALVHDRSRYARTLAEETSRQLRKSGVAPPTMLSIVGGLQDYSAVTRRLKVLQADVVFFAGYPPEARIIAADLKREGLSARFLGSDSLAVPEFADVAGADPERFAVLLMRDPGVEALTRAAIEAWAQSVRQTNGFEAMDVRAALARLSAQTAALGPVSFDEKGDARLVSFAPAVWNGMSWEPRD